MLTMLKITKIWIEHIDKIEVEEVQPFEQLGFSEKSISIWTKEGERYEISLQAHTSEELEFKKSDDSWVTPKVYKGQQEDQ